MRHSSAFRVPAPPVQHVLGKQRIRKLYFLVGEELHEVGVRQFNHLLHTPAGSAARRRLSSVRQAAANWSVRRGAGSHQS